MGVLGTFFFFLSLCFRLVYLLKSRNMVYLVLVCWSFPLDFR